MDDSFRRRILVRLRHALRYYRLKLAADKGNEREWLDLIAEVERDIELLAKGER